MKGALTTIFILCLLSVNIIGQTPAKFSIKGVLKDTFDQNIDFATVMLLSPIDSTLQNFTMSDDKGNFSFNSIKNTNYLLKVSHINFLPYQYYITENKDKNIDVGTIILQPINQTLMEVVIKAAKAPLFIRGDTVEYDATTFKVAPGSTVEDLLRRLPGIEVDVDGNISTQGKDVKRIYVDGKTFFGDDPKSVTKNLDAQIVSKVQVFDEKSEQAKLTGIDDGSEDKAMNLELKEEFKNGKFGKVSVSGGTEDRWAASGNYNKFNKKIQLSFISYANNINQTGVNWQDYSEFKGNNTFNNFDNGDFGFNGGGGRYYFFTSDGTPINNYNGKGLTKNFGGGANYNYDNKGTKINASYFYTQSALKYLSKSFKETFLNDLTSFNKTDTLNNDQFVSNHSVGTRFEREFNPNDRLIIKFNFKLSGNNFTQIQNISNTDYNYNDLNHLDIENISDNKINNITSAAIYRHLFKKKGRSFAISAGYNMNKDDISENLNTVNSFFDAITPTEQIRQLILSNKNVQEIKSSVLFTEPLFNNFYGEIFYNHSNLTNNKNRQANDPVSSLSRIDSLSVYYEQETNYNRIGTSLRYSNNGLNGSIGVAAQNISLLGKYAIDEGLPWTNIPESREFFNIVPNVDINYEIKRGTHLDFNYSNNISAPDFNDLYPVINSINPSYVIIGNPELTTSSTHRISLRYGFWNPASFSSFHISANYEYSIDPIVYNQRTEIDSQNGVVTISYPENMDNKTQLSSYLWTNLPIIKTKLSVYGNGNFTLAKTPIKINDDLDNTISNSYSLGTGIRYTPGQKLVFSLGINTNITEMKYVKLSNFNQNFYSYTANSAIKWQFLKNTFFESNFDYSVYKNDRYNFDQKYPIWNASIRQLLGKTNKFELRLAALDILNKNISINQYAVRNYIQTTETNTLTRYIMLTLTYNIKGFENKLEKGRFW